MLVTTQLGTQTKITASSGARAAVTTRVFYGFCLLVVLLMAAVAARWGWADLQALGARNLMTQWEKDLAVGTDSDWRRAVERMTVAVQLHPDDAGYAADLGRIYEWGAQRYPVWHRESQAMRARATHYFQHAVSLRPAWGYMWAQYAYSKILNQGLDQDALDALEKAMVLAPWEADVQLKVIWSGLHIWDQLPDDMRAMVRNEITRALAIQAGPALNLIARTRRHAVVEPLLDDRQQVMLSGLLATYQKQ